MEVQQTFGMHDSIYMSSEIWFNTDSSRNAVQSKSGSTSGSCSALGTLLKAYGFEIIGTRYR